MEIMILAVVAIVLMYVLTVIPQKKRMDAQRKLLSSMEPGSRVMLNTGMFGTLRAVGENQMVIELAPGVEVTVLKQAVVKMVSAAEEEFEYADSQVDDEDIQDSSDEPTAEVTSDELFSGSDEPAETTGQVAEAVDVAADSDPDDVGDRDQTKPVQ